MQTISITDALKQKDVRFVDVRSPKEYKEFHIPSAINIPIFSNEERVTVGTVYKQQGKEEAKKLGVSILSKKLPELYEQYVQLKKDNKLMYIYCWRGGMRSRSIVSFLDALDFPVFQITGGIRSYRELITEGLHRNEWSNKPFIVLEGNTGTAKTKILNKLQTLHYPVIDIEGLANHRGSTFGQIGLTCISQKEFEQKIYDRVIELKPSTYFIIEAESKRLGHLTLPEFLLEGKERGIRIHLEATLEDRIRTIMETYDITNHYDQFRVAIDRLKKRLPEKIAVEAELHFSNQNYKKLIEVLLTQYYDPRYEFKADQYDTPVYNLSVSMENGLEKVKNLIDNLVTEFPN